MKTTSKQKKVYYSAIKIIASILVMVLCFVRKQIIPVDNFGLNAIGTVVALIFIAASIYVILGSVTEIIVISTNKKNSTECNKDGPLKLWTPDELFDFLENEDIIDLMIDNEDILKIGTTSESESGQYKQIRYYNKRYYIQNDEYENFLEFQKHFLLILKGDVVKILYAGIEDMPVII